MSDDHDCHKCGKDVGDSGVRALEHTWHDTCFVCKECNKSFESAFVNIKGEPYHESCAPKDSIQEFSRCGTCDREIEDEEAVRVKGVDYHKGACFACNACGTPLTKSFVSVEGKIFCTKQECAKTHVAGRGTKDTHCKGCNKEFQGDEKLVRAEGDIYHSECWCCATCRKPFDPSTPFVLIDGKPYHKTEDASCLPADSKADYTCYKCSKLISGRRLEVDGGKRVFHAECWNCYQCGGDFTDGYVEDDKGPRHPQGKCK